MKKTATIIPICIILFILGSCSKKISFGSSPIVPGATGKVTVKKDNNNNYYLVVNTVNLTPSKNLTPARDVYVVWMEGADNSLKNLGQIKPSTGFLSKAYKGELKATTLTKPRRVFITAENDANIEQPGNSLVLSTDD